MQRLPPTGSCIVKLRGSLPQVSWKALMRTFVGGGLASLVINLDGEEVGVASSRRTRRSHGLPLSQWQMSEFKLFGCLGTEKRSVMKQRRCVMHMMEDARLERWARLFITDCVPKPGCIVYTNVLGSRTPYLNTHAFHPSSARLYLINCTINLSHK